VGTIQEKLDVIDTLAKGAIEEIDRLMARLDTQRRGLYLSLDGANLPDAATPTVTAPITFYVLTGTICYDGVYHVSYHATLDNARATYGTVKETFFCVDEWKCEHVTVSSDNSVTIVECALE
jgi:hypothetical protein